MGNQSQIFLDGEADAWLKRNRDKLPVKDDLVLSTIKDCKIKPRVVLEIGCADGWRLREIKARYNCECHGIDPGVYGYHTLNGISLYRGVASSLHLFKAGQFDLVIFGFCLYLADPEDYFIIAAEANRVLADKGYLIVYDFCAIKPQRFPYKHKAGVFTHKMDFYQLWAWHPHYQVIANLTHEREQISASVLRKDIGAAFS